jgi:hypothetical protein
MVRSGRLRRTPGRFWSEIGVSAGVLLVPPILVGAVVYGLLPAPEEPARNSSPAAADFLPADFASRSAFDISAELPLAFAAPLSPTTGTAIAAVDPLMTPVTKPAASALAAKPTASPVATKPVIAAKPDVPVAKPAAVEKAAAAEPTTFALASEHSELVGKEVTRAGALGPVPVQVTVVVAPNVAETETGQPVSLGAASPESTAALPPAPAAAPAARSTEPQREHHAGTPHGPRHFRHVARHNQARPDAHPEEVQRAAEPPQHDFSLRNLFQQQQPQPQQQPGGRQKNAVRG